MSEDLIRRSDAIKAIRYTMLGALNTEERISLIMDIPTIEPKRGKWGLMRTVKYNSRPEHWLKCSACGNFRIIKAGEAFPHFCENCGADMRGKDDE